MLILRDKEYSSRWLQTIRGARKAGNRAMTAIDNFGLRAGNAIKEVVTGKQVPAHMKVTFQPKTTAQINRETVAGKMAAKRAGEKIVYTPGAVANDGIKYAVENPITASVGVASKVAMVTNPATAAIPFGNIALGGEMALKRVAPGYSRATKRVGEAYGRSGFSRRMQNLPSLPTMANTIPAMIPL